MKYNGVIAVEKSSNKKIGECSQVSISQASCPSTCAFLNNGCYAQSGLQAIHTKKLNKSTLNPLELAKEEAKAINDLSGKRPLRIGIVGDHTTNEIVKIVASAAANYTNKHGNPTFGYTHAHSNVERSNWGHSSILASCESVLGAKQAISRGWAPALVVKEFQSEKAWVDSEGYKYIPCPAQLLKTTTCSTCKLCMKDKFLLKNKSIIVFASHSQGKKKIDQALTQITL